VRELLDAVGRAKVPCMSIVNMPPLGYLRRIPGLDAQALKPAYTDASVWDNVDPAYITLCSLDPQAIRPPDEKVNVLRQLQDEIEARSASTQLQVLRLLDDVQLGGRQEPYGARQKKTTKGCIAQCPEQGARK
jgi:hypothetical protein